MAYIEDKPNGKALLVRWRDADGRKRAEQFRWDVGSKTEAEVRAHAAEVAAEIERTIERRGNSTAARDRALKTTEAVLGRRIEPIFSRENFERYQFASYIRRMIEQQDLRPSTRELYERNVRNHIDGRRIAGLDIRDITPTDLTDYKAGLKIGRAAWNNVQQLISKAFNRALVEGVIDVNPLKRAPDVKRSSKGSGKETTPLTVEQVEALAAAAKHPRDRLEILVMAYGGLRAGEVGGLRLKDIDFKRCQLRLRQQVVRVTGRGQYIEELKTAAAKRTVTLPCSVTDELKAFVEAEPPAPDGRVFHAANGAMRAHNAVNHGVKTAAERAGIDTHAHSLRHTAVSLAIEAGANPKAIQAMVGHSDIRMTLGTYGHLFDYGGQAIATSLEELRDRYLNGDS